MYNAGMKALNKINKVSTTVNYCLVLALLVISLINTVTASDKSQEPFRLTQCEEEIFRLVNEYRKSLISEDSVLENDLELGEIANRHGLDMINRNYFDHFSPEGTNPHQRIMRQHHTQLVNSTGENIWLRDSDESTDSMVILANKMVTDWMHSKHHRDNILSEEFNLIGISVLQSGDWIVAVQNFVGSMGTVKPRIPDTLRRGETFSISIGTSNMDVFNPRKFDLVMPDTETPVCDPIYLRVGHLDCPAGEYRLRLYFLSQDETHWEIYVGPVVTVL